MSSALEKVLSQFTKVYILLYSMIVQPIVLPTGPINQIVYRYIGREEQNTTDFMAKLPSRILHTEQICGE